MSKGSPVAGLLGALAIGFCCGVPVLVASGALGVIGGWLARARPIVLAGAAVLGYGIYRWTRLTRAVRMRSGRL